MKKLILLLICLGLGVHAFAFYEDLTQRVKKLELLENNAFEWDPVERCEEYFQEVVSVAKEVYEKNPGSFNAAYNYGVLQYDVYINEVLGPAVSKEELAQALKAFDHALTLKPNKKMAFEREYAVLKEILVGTHVDRQFDEELLEIFEAKPKYAEKFGVVIERLFQFQNIEIGRPLPSSMQEKERSDWQDKAFYAFLVNLALKKDQQARKWLVTYGGPEELKESYFAERDITNDLRMKESNPAWWSKIQKNYNEALGRIGINVAPWKKAWQQKEQERQAEERAQQEKVMQKQSLRWLQRAFEK